MCVWYGVERQGVCLLTKSVKIYRMDVHTMENLISFCFEVVLLKSRFDGTILKIHE